MDLSQLSDTELAALISHYKLPLTAPISFQQNFGHMTPQMFSDMIPGIGQKLSAFGGTYNPNSGAGSIPNQQAYWNRTIGQAAPNNAGITAEEAGFASQSEVQEERINRFGRAIPEGLKYGFRIGDEMDGNGNRLVPPEIDQLARELAQKGLSPQHDPDIQYYLGSDFATKDNPAVFGANEGIRGVKNRTSNDENNTGGSLV